MLSTLVQHRIKPCLSSVQQCITFAVVVFLICQGHVLGVSVLSNLWLIVLRLCRSHSARSCHSYVLMVDFSWGGGAVWMMKSLHRALWFYKQVSGEVIQCLLSYLSYDQPVETDDSHFCHCDVAGQRFLVFVSTHVLGLRPVSFFK